MLSQLLEIKQKREDRLRIQLSREERRLKEIQANLQNVLAQRDLLQQEWRQIGELSRGHVTPRAFEELQRRLAACHQQDTRYAAECLALRNELQRLEVALQQLGAQLRITIIKQEKLRYLVENHA